MKKNLGPMVRTRLNGEGRGRDRAVSFSLGVACSWWGEDLRWDGKGLRCMVLIQGCSTGML